MTTIVALVYRPASRHSGLIRNALLVVGGSLLVAISAKIQVSGLVPFTMQPWAVLLVGAALGGRLGMMSLIAYLLEGAAGLPVFAQPVPGAAYLVGPTGGYLFAFPLAAFVVGRLAERGWDRRFGKALIAFAMGDLIILAFGGAWLASFMGGKAALADGVLKFLPGDALKIVLAAFALPAAWRLTGRGTTAASQK